MKKISWRIRQMILTIGTPETQKTQHPDLPLANAEEHIDAWEPGELPAPAPHPPTAGTGNVEVDAPTPP